jgi:hypothetical protein
MTAPHDSSDAHEPDGDQTLENRPTPAKLDDLYPTIANNPAAPNKTERPALYAFLAPPSARCPRRPDRAAFDAASAVIVTRCPIMTISSYWLLAH